MIVFVGNLPPQATVNGLSSLFWFRSAPGMRIFKRPDGNGGTLRYGLASVDSRRDGVRLIRRLHGKLYGEQQLTAHEYKQRFLGNERRRLDWREVDWDGPERRGNERRQAG